MMLARPASCLGFRSRVIGESFAYYAICLTYSLQEEKANIILSEKYLRKRGRNNLTLKRNSIFTSLFLLS